MPGLVWVVCMLHPVSGNIPTHPPPAAPCWWVTAMGAAVFQAGHNFYNVDLSYVKKLCGTFLGGPKLPQR